MNEVLDYLSQTFKSRDWFFDVGVEQYGRPVVYVKYMCHETLYDIPDTVGGKQVLVHFAASKTVTLASFVNQGTTSAIQPPPLPHEPFELVNEVMPVSDEELEVVEDKSMARLQSELDKLEKLCNSNSLQDIFYEVHDGRNAVTNLSSRYPEVRTRMEELYRIYGFDVIYEELDG